MAYIDVIPLATAKLHLRIEDDSFDAEITRMISSALSFIENYTNYKVFARDMEYYSSNLCVRVYDFPINTVLAEGVTKRGLYSIYDKTNVDDITTLNVGYTDPADVPTGLVDVALQMIDVWFYGAEKQVNTQLIPNSVFDVLNSYKRFIL